MSDLVVVSFKGEDTADQVLNKLREMQKEYLIDLEDACVVVRNKDGKVRLKQAINLISAGAAGGAAWGGLFGALIGILFLNPLLGLVTGVALGGGAGALSGALADYGINDDFIRSLGQSIEPGSSALFVLVRRVTLDKVLPELRPFGGKILKTSLSTEEEKRLREAVEEMRSAAATV
jgi:uncharacterized membrane protein